MFLGQEYRVFDWFIIHFTENPGMAFGLELGGNYGKLALSVFRIVAIIAITFWLRKLIQQKAAGVIIIGVSFIFAGAIGNILDSAFYGLIFDDSAGQIATLFPGGGRLCFLFAREGS